MFFYTEIVGGSVLNVLFSLFCLMMTNRSTVLGKVEWCLVFTH